jgi:hypothetical protein
MVFVQRSRGTWIIVSIPSPGLAWELATIPCLVANTTPYQTLRFSCNQLKYESTSWALSSLMLLEDFSERWDALLRPESIRYPPTKAFKATERLQVANRHKFRTAIPQLPTNFIKNVPEPEKTCRRLGTNGATSHTIWKVFLKLAIVLVTQIDHKPPPSFESMVLGGRI